MHIAVSSFGIGAHFDEKLMLKIAELGGGFCINKRKGRFSFVKINIYPMQRI